MRSTPSVYFLALILGSCAATPPELAVKPGDQCRVFWQQKNSPAPRIELVNRTLYNADKAAELRCTKGSAKVMADSEMALLVQELSDKNFFRSAMAENLPPGSRTSLGLEINGARWALVPTGSGATDVTTAAADYGTCGRLLQDAYNATLGSQQGELKKMTGEEFFRQEQERLQKENEERKKRHSEGGR